MQMYSLSTTTQWANEHENGIPSVKGRNPYKSNLHPHFFLPTCFPLLFHNTEANSLAEALGMPVQLREAQREKRLILFFLWASSLLTKQRLGEQRRQRQELNGTGGVGLTHAESSQLLYTCPGEKTGQLLLLRPPPDFNRDLLKGAWTWLNAVKESEEWTLGRDGRKKKLGE